MKLKKSMCTVEVIFSQQNTTSWIVSAKPNLAQVQMSKREILKIFSPPLRSHFKGMS